MMKSGVRMTRSIVNEIRNRTRKEANMSLFGNMFDDADPKPQEAAAGTKPAKEYTRPTPQSSKPKMHDESGQYLMPFGKHRNEPVLTLPPSYLAWLWWEYPKDLYDPLKSNVAEGLKSYNIDPEGEKPFFKKDQ